MSLEEALAANTAAILAHTAMLAKLGGAKPAAAAAKPAAAAAAKPAAAKPAAAKPKAPTIEDIRAKFGGYLSIKDKPLREVRLEQVAAINAHFGVAKASDLEATLFAEALGYLASYEAGEEPEFAQSEGGEGDEGEDEGESLV